MSQTQRGGGANKQKTIRAIGPHRIRKNKQGIKISGISDTRVPAQEDGGDHQSGPRPP